MNADGETCVIDPARFYLGSVACEEAWFSHAAGKTRFLPRSPKRRGPEFLQRRVLSPRAHMRVHPGPTFAFTQGPQPRVRAQSSEGTRYKHLEPRRLATSGKVLRLCLNRDGSAKK